MLTKEEMKNKAVEILKKIGCYKPYLKAYRDKDIITMYEGYGGYYVDKSEPELQEKINEVESKHKGLVYAIIHDIYAFGECYTMLYISPYEEDEDYMCSIADNTSYVYSYVWNKSDDNCSEFGTVGIKTALGGLIRIS